MENPRNILAQNTSVAKSQEDNISLVSEEIEGRITKKLSKEFSTTESRILRALSQPDEFLLNPLVQGHSGYAPETPRNALNIKEGTHEDNSQVDPHPEARVSQSQTTQFFGPNDYYDNPTIIFLQIKKSQTRNNSNKQYYRFFANRVASSFLQLSVENLQ